MRTTRIGTILLALAPTAILGSPVPVRKAGVTTSDHPGLTDIKTTNLNHGLANRDDHNPPTKTVDPGDLCINDHATVICTPGGEDNPDRNQNTKRSKPDDSVNPETTVAEAAAKVKGRDDTDPNEWNCSSISLRQYQCTGGPDNETCIFDDGRKVSCTNNQQTAAHQTNARNGKGPDFTCVTDARGVCVCTGADVRCVIEKQGDATCSFTGPDGFDGDASKFKVNTERLAAVLSTVAPKPVDASDPFDTNRNYSCSQISDWTWSCGANGAGPGPPSGNSRISDDEHYDPGQGCNQPQGFFGGCDGRPDFHKIEVDEVPKASVSGSDVSCVDLSLPLSPSHPLTTNIDPDNRQQQAPLPLRVRRLQRPPICLPLSQQHPFHPRPRRQPALHQPGRLRPLLVNRLQDLQTRGPQHVPPCYLQLCNHRWRTRTRQDAQGRDQREHEDGAG